MKEKAEQLTKQILEILRDHYLSAGQFKRENVYEALGALGIAVAVTVEGCGDPEAVEYFNDVVQRQRDEIVANSAKIISEGLAAEQDPELN